MPRAGGARLAVPEAQRPVVALVPEEDGHFTRGASCSLYEAGGALLRVPAPRGDALGSLGGGGSSATAGPPGAVTAMVYLSACRSEWCSENTAT